MGSSKATSSSSEKIKSAATPGNNGVAKANKGAEEDTGFDEDLEQALKSLAAGTPHKRVDAILLKIAHRVAHEAEGPMEQALYITRQLEEKGMQC